MDKLITYLNSLDKKARTEFVKACGTSENYMRKARSSGQKFRWELCLVIEQVSKGQVTRKDLRDDWQLVWPDIADADALDRVKAADDVQPPVGGAIDEQGK